ncbi:uncharacterized protein PRCAT00006079001 [Priceomyces carsonii]|uniref:uncharacterized protein n=1 Tax=Priceomyces carsonii TaxID=28549 RepID=UPI002EDAB893|nr:unnamed protein product [Priceomyces carsonii]
MYGSKKRNRLSLSCNYCKKRKVKCDRGRPCSSCVRYNVPDRCKYDEGYMRNEDGSNTSTFYVRTVSNEEASGFYDYSVNKTIQRDSDLRNYENTTKPSLIQASLKPHTNAELAAELENLKQKYKEMEGMIVGNNDHQIQNRFQVNSSSPRVPNNDYNLGEYHNFDISESRPIQLPPLNWIPLPTNPDTHEKGEDYMDPSILKKNPQFIGINPYSSPDDIINFYEGYSPVHVRGPRKMNHGPFSWFSLVKKDPCLSKLWDFLVHNKVNFNGQPSASVEKLFDRVDGTLSQGKKTIERPAENLEVQFQVKAMDREGYNDVLLYNEFRTAIENSKENNKLTVLNKNAISLGLTFFEGKIDQELKLIEKIEVVLPEQKVIWTLINKFFKNVYAFIPFIDEKSFKSEMSRIIGPEGYNQVKISPLKIEKRLDFAYVGILLLMLRLSYLSLFSNRKKVNEQNLSTSDPSLFAQEKKYLLSHPISIDIVEMADLCLKQFNLCEKSNLIIFQFAFMTRLYRVFSPEDGDGSDGSDSQVSTGMLVHMAYSIGLNRDPDNFPEQTFDKKTNNLGRKLWFFLVIVDLLQSYFYGNPSTIDAKYFDTKLPYYVAGNENVNDVEIEKNVISTFRYFEAYYKHLKRILDLTLAINSKTRVQELCSDLSLFEIFLNNTYGSLKNFMMPFDEDNYPFPFVKTMKCKNSLNMKHFMLSIYYFIFLFYEARHDVEMSYFYLRKMVAIICIDLVPCFHHLVSDNHLYFGDSADLILNPVTQSICHRVLSLFFGFLARINLLVYTYKRDKLHSMKLQSDSEYNLKFSRLCHLSKSLEKICWFTITVLSRLSERYYFAWRITKANNFCLKAICGELIYKSLEFESIFSYLDADKLGELVSFTLSCENNLKKFQNQYPQEDDKRQEFNRSGQSKAKDLSPEKGTESDKFHLATAPSTYDGSGLPSLGEDSFNADEFHILENPEIDQLWFQMASLKNEKTVTTKQDPAMNGTGNPLQGANYSHNNSTGFNSAKSTSMPPTGDTGDTLPSLDFPISPASWEMGMDITPTDNVFDIFSSLPINMLFGLDAKQVTDPAS